MQLKDFLELVKKNTRHSIRHVYYDDSQEDIKLLKEYLQSGQKSSTPFYKKQVYEYFDDLKNNERAIILTAGVDPESKEFSKVEFIIARQNGASMEAEKQVSILVSDGESKCNEHRVKTQGDLVERLRGELKKYTGSRVYGYHIFPDVWRLFHEHVFEQPSEEKKLPFVLVELATALDEADVPKNSQSVEECFELFKKIKGKKEPYSSYVFILPFKIDKKSPLKRGFEEQRNFSDKWKKINDDFPYFNSPYELAKNDIVKSKEYLKYNHNCFLNAETFSIINKHTLNFLYQSEENYYRIDCYKPADDKEGIQDGEKVDSYYLNINYIMMRLVGDVLGTKGREKKVDSRYADIGFLIISADNYQYDDPVIIQKINQFGRRVYPPFFANNLGYRDCPDDIRLEKEKSDDIAKSKYKGHEEFRVMTAIQNLLKSFFLADSDSGRQLKIFEGSTDEKEDGVIYINRIIDDRMFVHSNYKFSDESFRELSTAIKGIDSQQLITKAKIKVSRRVQSGGRSYATNLMERKLADKEQEFIYSAQKKLYSYIYVDKSIDYVSSNSPISITDLLQHSLYDRWVDLGTIYGVTQHSMLLLSNSSIPPFLLAYFYSEYLEMILFVLMQRVWILNYSERAGEQAQKARNSNDSASFGKEALNLHKEYVVFKNQYLLPELSPQEQAIELYELMQNNLYVNRQKLILDEQIESLFEISQAEEAVAQRERDNRLNKTILMLTVFTIFTALADFSNSVDILFKNNLTEACNHPTIHALVILSLYVLCLWGSYKISDYMIKYFDKQNKLKD